MPAAKAITVFPQAKIKEFGFAPRRPGRDPVAGSTAKTVCKVHGADAPRIKDTGNGAQSLILKSSWKWVPIRSPPESSAKEGVQSTESAKAKAVGKSAKSRGELAAEAQERLLRKRQAKRQRQKEIAIK